MATKKYISLNKLSVFLDNLKSLFATKTELGQKSQVQIVRVGEAENLTENVSTLKIHKLTKAQYDEMVSSGNIDETALYLTPDEEVDLSGYVTIEQLGNKSDVVHTHNISDINELQSSFDLVNENLSNKANTEHTHNILDVNGLQETLDELEGNIIAKAELEHTHEVSDITDIQELLNERVSINTTINGKLLNSDIILSAEDVEADAIGSAEAALESAKGYADDLIGTKADIEHNHNDIYYTESEVDEKFSEINSSVSNIISGATVVAKASHATNADNAVSSDSAIKATQDSNGNIIGTTYETKYDASSKLIEAKSYADNIKNDLLNGAGDAYDTLRELGELIDDNTDAIDALEIVAAGKANKVHEHDDLYYTEFEIEEKIAVINTSISNATKEAKSHSDTNFNMAKSYTDDLVSQKTQVQIITWGADD